MKYSVISLAFVAALAAAQDGIPKCAVACLAKYTQGNEIAGCKQLDIKCVCQNSAFIDGIACCLKDACDASGQADAIKYASQICSGQGVKTPTEVVCKEGAASGSSTGTAASKTESATDSAGSQTSGGTPTPTNSKDAAASLSGAGGIFGAVLAVLFAV